MAALYIHIPFCKTRCTYCDFFSQTHLTYINVYTKALVRELEIQKDYLEGETIETIYWGGGTPSLLQADDFESVFNAINRLYNVSPCVEITLEANPEDISQEYVDSLRRFPFNRVSIGIQSFKDNDLKLLNRRHTAKQALNAVSLCQKAGYSNLNIDLMYGLPGQTLQMWKENLDEVLRLNIPHLSAYHLSYEEGTVMYQQLNEGVIEPVNEETSILFFDKLIETLLAAGYVHYEISNFCKPDYFSRHNTAYWTDIKYLGVGAAAHSYNHHSRQWNIATLPGYIEGITKGIPSIEKESLNAKTKYNDSIMTRLRTIWGIPLSFCLASFGSEQTEYLIHQAKPYLQNEMMEQVDNILRITRKGRFVTDGIIRDLMM